MEMFREAQQNILDLNQSRLLALEELQNARSRIADLEERVMEAEAAAAEAVALAEAKSAAAAASTAEQRSEQARLARQQNDTSSEVGVAVENMVTLVYKTGWPKVYLHYRADGGEWSSLPGIPLEEHEPGYKKAIVKGSCIEFLMNDGEGHWDKRGDGCNYSLDCQGTYLLADGQLTKLDLDAQ